ncbi:unnamed protein product [Scytosiphon promiscuus]
MSYFEAKALTGAVDQSGRFVWVDKRNQQATYQLQDSNGIPFLHHPMTYGAQPAPMPMVGPVNWCPMQPAPMPMAYPTGWCPPPPMAPFAGAGWFRPQPAGGTVPVVGEPEEEDKWVRYCDEESGNYYYHNKRKGETTWDKPEEFDKQEKDGKPPPPETEKEDK